jgi:hypothetical protein
MEVGIFWIPEKVGDELVGLVSGVRNDSFKPDKLVYLIRELKLENNKWIETGEIKQTPSHTVLINELEVKDPEIGDLVQIQYKGLAEKPSKYGQKAKIYKVGLVKKFEAAKFLGALIQKVEEAANAPDLIDEAFPEQKQGKNEENKEMAEAKEIVDQMLKVYKALPLKGPGSIEFFIKQIRGFSIEPEEIIKEMSLVQNTEGNYGYSEKK